MLKRRYSKIKNTLKSVTGNLFSHWIFKLQFKKLHASWLPFLYVDSQCSQALNMDPSLLSVSIPLAGCLLPLLVVNNTTAAPLPPVTPLYTPVCYTLGHYHLVRLTGFGEGDGGGPAGGTPAPGALFCSAQAAGSLCYRWTPTCRCWRNQGIGAISEFPWIPRRVELLTLWWMETHTLCACMINLLKAAFICYVIQGLSDA